jgi:hypothetical protein
MTIRAITPAQAGHAAADGCGSALTDRAPHLGQKADPSNIWAKQRGQAIVASRARQYGHRGECGSAAAPQFGQCSESASFIPTSNAHRIDLSPPVRGAGSQWSVRWV